MTPCHIHWKSREAQVALGSGGASCERLNSVKVFWVVYDTQLHLGITGKSILK
jgi:hypothetical protein